MKIDKMNKISNYISHIKKKLAISKAGCAIFLMLNYPVNTIKTDTSIYQDDIYKSISMLDNLSDRSESENSDNLKNLNRISSFENYTMPKLEYNDYKNGTKNDTFEYLRFAGNMDKNGDVKKTKILEYLKNTDSVYDLVDKLCDKSFSDKIDWQKDAKSLDLVWGMLESGNDRFAKSIANCVGMRQFSIGAAEDYGIAKRNHKGKLVSDMRTNSIANISASHRYLKDNYDVTKDLGLSYWGYHCGLKNLSNIKHIYNTRIGKTLTSIYDLYYDDNLPDELTRKISSLKDNSFDYFAKINTAKYIYKQRKENPNYIYEKVEIANKIKKFKQKGSMVEYERYPINDEYISKEKSLTGDMIKLDIAKDSTLDMRMLYVLNFLQKKSGSDIYILSDFAKLENRAYYDDMGIHVNAILLGKGVKIPISNINNYSVFRFYLCQMRIWGWISWCEEQLTNGQKVLNISINPNINLIDNPKIAQKIQ